jgi:hypothetical protein
MAVTLEQLIGWIQIKGADQARRDVEGVHRAFDGLAGVINSVGTLGGVAFLFSQIGEAFRALGNVTGLNMAGQFQRLEMGFTAILGSGSKARDLLKEINAIASETPFGNLEVGKFAQDMLAAGFSSKTLANDMRAILNATASLGRTGFDAGRAIGALGRIRRDINQVDADELNEFANAIGLPISRVASAGSGKKMNDQQAAKFLQSLKPEQAAQVLIDGIKKEFGKASGFGFLATLGNVWDELNNIMAPTGALLMKVLEPLAGLALGTAKLLKSINELSNGWVGLAALLGVGAVGVALTATAAIGALTTAITALGAAALAVTSGMAVASGAGIIGGLAALAPIVLAIGALIALITGAGYAVWNKFFAGSKTEGTTDPMVQEQKKTNQLLQDIKTQQWGGGDRTRAARSLYEAEIAFSNALNF